MSKGGHGVPDEKVISRHRRTLAMLYDYYLKADNMSVWDNSETSPDENAHTIKKLLVKNVHETTVFEHADEVIWFKCKKPRHVRSECPRLKKSFKKNTPKKALMAMWDVTS